jgi:hypothetical protein
MRKSFLYLPILFAFILVVTGCGSKTVEPTATENLTKTWSVDIASHDGTQVYKKGGSSNTVTSYLNYRLALTAPNAVTLTTADASNTAFTGTWALSTDNKTLTLSGLKNAGSGQGPTGLKVAGQMIFDITSPITATTVTIRGTETDLKIGSKIVNLQLVNP